MVVNLDQLEILRDARIPMYSRSTDVEEPYTNLLDADKLVAQLRDHQKLLVQGAGSTTPRE
jgi:hypothetical protein